MDLMQMMKLLVLHHWLLLKMMSVVVLLVLNEDVDVLKMMKKELHALIKDLYPDYHHQ